MNSEKKLGQSKNYFCHIYMCQNLESCFTFAPNNEARTSLYTAASQEVIIALYSTELFFKALHIYYHSSCNNNLLGMSLLLQR